MRQASSIIGIFLALTGACGDDTGATTGDGDALADATGATDAEADTTADAGPDSAVDTTSATSDSLPSDAADSAPSDAEPADGAATDGVSVDVTPPPPLDLWDDTRVHEVVIRMRLVDWDALRLETRAIDQVLGPGCLEAPAEDVFNWYHADVTIDGHTVADAGLRKKGFFGSLDVDRPSFRIEADHWVDDARFDDVEHVTLNNGRQDPSRFRTCLAYETFIAAGVPAPRCTYAHVDLNGADLGLYINVEPVKKAFLRRVFGEAPPAADRPDGLGQLWEGALSDFRKDWLFTFDKKLDEVPTTLAPLEAVVAALEAPDDGLVAALEAVIDLDGFFTFWATEVLVGHWDGYAGNTNNFFVYHGADGRLVFMPWGTDGTFVDPGAAGPGRPTAVLAVGALAHRLHAHPEGRKRYEAELTRLLEEVWDEDAIEARIDAWQALGAGSREPGSADAAAASLAALRDFVRGRRAAIEAELAGDVAWPDPLRDSLCADLAGTLSGELSTTWGTLGIDNLFETGTGDIDLDSEVLPPIAFGLFGAKAGENPEAPGRAELVLAAQIDGADYVVLIVRTPLPLVPGVRALEDPATEAYVYYLEPPDNVQLLGFLATGTLDLEEAGDYPSARIQATFAGSLYLL